MAMYVMAPKEGCVWPQPVEQGRQVVTDTHCTHFMTRREDKTPKKKERQTD